MDYKNLIQIVGKDLIKLNSIIPTIMRKVITKYKV